MNTSYLNFMIVYILFILIFALNITLNPFNNLLIKRKSHNIKYNFIMILPYQLSHLLLLLLFLIDLAHMPLFTVHLPNERQYLLIIQFLDWLYSFQLECMDDMVQDASC